MRPLFGSTERPLAAPSAFAYALTCLLLCAPGVANAQSTGLKISSWGTGMSVTAADGGLRLNISLPNDNRVFGPMLSTSVHSMATAPVSSSGISTRNVLAADWLQLGGGVHSTVGLSWRQTTTSTPDQLTRQIDSRSPSTAPYLSLGWRGEPIANSGWRLSAELGAYFSTVSECRPNQSCLKIPRTNASKDAAGGVSWNPYISLGATFSY